MAENDNAIWSDLNRDGRRLERIIKHMETKSDNEADIDTYFSYIDRLLKATHEKVLIVDRVLAVKKILREAEKLTYVHNSF
jgi:hypothetical protein